MSAAAPIRYTTVNVLTKADNLNHFYKADTALRRYYALRTAVGGCALYARCSGCTEYRILGYLRKWGWDQQTIRRNYDIRQEELHYKGTGVMPPLPGGAIVNGNIHQT